MIYISVLTLDSGSLKMTAKLREFSVQKQINGVPVAFVCVEGGKVVS